MVICVLLVVINSTKTKNICDTLCHNYKFKNS